MRGSRRLKRTRRLARGVRVPEEMTDDYRRGLEEVGYRYGYEDGLQGYTRPRLYAQMDARAYRRGFADGERDAEKAS